MVATPDFSVLGRSGLIQYGGFVQEEWLTELRGDKGRKAIREMLDQDDVVGSVMLVIEMLMRQMDWRIDPSTEDQADVDAAQFVDDCLHDMSTSWNDTLSEIITFLPFGFSWMECVYKRRSGQQADPGSRFNDGRIGWRKWSLRAQESLYKWEFDDEGGVQAMVQQVASGQTYTIPIDKSLLFRTTARKSNPEGRSLLRNAYRAAYFKKHIEAVEGIGVERDLAGLPVAYVPPELLSSSAGTDETAALTAIKQIVTNIRRDEQEGVVFPLAYDADGHQIYKLELLTSGGARQFDTNVIINRYSSRIAMTMLADFVLLGHETVGSFALADSKTNLFAYALGAFADSICDVINSHAIPRLLALNGIAVDDPPKLVHGDVESANLNDVGVYLERLSAAGMQLFPNPALEKHLLEIASMPAPEDAAAPAAVAPPVEDAQQQDARLRTTEAYLRRHTELMESGIEALKHALEGAHDGDGTD